MPRPNTEEYFLGIAKLAAQRATCHRRSVGCVLTDHHNYILSTGYNGPAKEEPHCIDDPCAGAHQPTGQGLHLCKAIHAEINAIIQCPDTTKIKAAYITASPCIFCVRALMNTSCREIYFLEEYPHQEARQEWRANPRRVWHHYPNGAEWIKQLFTVNMLMA
jgi:dCMP deaminase